MILKMTYDIDREHLIVRIEGIPKFSEDWVHVVSENMTLEDIVEEIERSLDENSAYD